MSIPPQWYHSVLCHTRAFAILLFCFPFDMTVSIYIPNTTPYEKYRLIYKIRWFSSRFWVFLSLSLFYAFHYWEPRAFHNNDAHYAELFRLWIELWCFLPAFDVATFDVKSLQNWFALFLSICDVILLSSDARPFPSFPRKIIHARTTCMSAEEVIRFIITMRDGHRASFIHE